MSKMRFFKVLFLKKPFNLVRTSCRVKVNVSKVPLKRETPLPKVATVRVDDVDEVSIAPGGEYFYCTISSSYLSILPVSLANSKKGLAGSSPVTLPTLPRPRS